MMNFWRDFQQKHPKAAQWIREGGLFVIVCNLVTVFKYLILQFLPKLLSALPETDFGWPGIDMTLLGEIFKWNILGYDAAHGGLRYFTVYMIAMVVGEAVNFPIQRNFVFRSKGNVWYQIMWYVIACAPAHIYHNGGSAPRHQDPANHCWALGYQHHHEPVCPWT